MDTRCVHAGVEDNEHGAVVPPIYQTSTFKFESSQHGASLFAGEQKGYIYSRMGNPTVEAMEDAIAALEGGHKGLGCASGMSAIHTVLGALLSQGDHMVCSNAVYGPTNTLVRTILSRYGIKSTFVDSDITETIEKAMTPETKVVYVETPGNPTLAVTDLQAVADIAHKHGVLLVVDNTFMSPILQQPFALGADIVLHSMTKFLNGHADVVGGVIITKDEEMYLNMRKHLNQFGGMIAPFDAFLVHRGIKTLALRMERSAENAVKVAEYLAGHEKVESVLYPWMESHPNYEVAKRQQKSGGGMITFFLKDGYRGGEILMNNVKLATLAVSLGGVESLIQHPASMTHFSMGPEARKQANIGEGLVRYSVGIESADELIADLDQALAQI